MPRLHGMTFTARVYEYSDMGPICYPMNIRQFFTLRNQQFVPDQKLKVLPDNYSSDSDNIMDVDIRYSKTKFHRKSRGHACEKQFVML